MIETFQHSDLETVQGSFGPDAVWDFPGSSVVNGTFRGPDEIVAFLASTFERSGGSLAIEPIDLTSSDKGAAHVQWVTAEHGGRTLRGVEILYHEVEDGRIVRTWHRSDEQAITAFFGEA